MHAQASSSPRTCHCQDEALRKWAAECKERYPGHPGFVPDFPGQTPSGQAVVRALPPDDLAAMEALLAPAVAATLAGGSFTPAAVEFSDGHVIEIAPALGDPDGSLVLHARSCTAVRQLARGGE